jgi:hypothetical protein
MSAEPHAVADAAPAPEPLATLDLFTLGRRAVAARDALHGRRGFFVRTRQLTGTGDWAGPRDAAEAFIEEADVTGVRALVTARAAGVGTLLSGGDFELARAAVAAGLRVIWRFPFQNGENDADRLTRLADLARILPGLAAVMPWPEGEPYGLDTLRLFALCRLALPAVPHVLADVTRLGPRLAQMTFGFGASELFGPIVAERALRLGDNANNPALTRKEAATLLRGAGLIPHERLGDGAVEEVTA